MPRSLTQIRKTLKTSFDELDKAHKKGDKKAFNRAVKRFDKASTELKKRGASMETGSMYHHVPPRKKRK